MKILLLALTLVAVALQHQEPPAGWMCGNNP